MASRSRWWTTRRSTRPTDSALKAAIPVVGYNADALGNSRLAYIGQDLFASGQEMGNRIIDLVGSGPTSRSSSRPRVRPTCSLASTGRSPCSSPTRRSRPATVATGAAVPAELSTIDSYVTGHSDVKGPVRRRRRQHAERGPDRAEALAAPQGGQGRRLRPHADRPRSCSPHDQIDFTIDQQPYLQGFLPVLELYLYAVSKTLTGMADVNTGLKFLDKRHREALQQHQVAVRGYVEALPACSRPDQLHVTTERLRKQTPRHPRRAAGEEARGRGGLSTARRLLTLREGSIVVVTVLASRLLLGGQRALHHHREHEERCCRTSLRSRSLRWARSC